MDDLFDFTAPIKALSLWQPWASLVAAGVKADETRHWRTPYRGLVAIHAARTIDVAGAPERLSVAALGANWSRTVPIGMVVAIAALGAVRTVEAALREHLTAANLAAGNFTAGRFAWRFDAIRPLLRPVPATGRQGLFNWTAPADIRDNLAAPLDHGAACARIGWRT